ncbi:hypothetical protein Ae356Ps1_6250 [Pseudonocardia sp. Ae356_Ps1]|nr:hypothetical protein Ae356Ps1_6250 [Pseudonocardia sp. Ae356_Ps1]
MNSHAITPPLQGDGHGHFVGRQVRPAHREHPRPRRGHHRINHTVDRGGHDRQQIQQPLLSPLGGSHDQVDGELRVGRRTHRTPPQLRRADIGRRRRRHRRRIVEHPQPRHRRHRITHRSRPLRDQPRHRRTHAITGDR